MVILSRQPLSKSSELFPPEEFLGDALLKMKTAPSDERGAIFTRPEVVDFMLDLSGYTLDRPLWRFRLLEPSFGGGEFLLRAVERLLQAAQKAKIAATELSPALRAVELHGDTFQQGREALAKLLKEHRVPDATASNLLDAWLKNADFLLEPYGENFDFVVGNPPYVRQELIPASLLAEYRQRFATLYDRADLYVPFMEKSLGLLKDEGQVCFICSDRWMKNRYGGPLRAMISSGYSLRYYVDMVGTAAFQSEVTAYPAITVIRRGQSSEKPLLAHRPDVSSESLRQLHQLFTGPVSNYNGTVSMLATSPRGDEPWLLESDAQPSLELVRRLEAAFPTMEEAGCSVGIGVATGADKVYIAPYDELDVEDERKLPLVMTKDILEGEVRWKGFGVVNPFEENGTLADFAAYPRFARYMNRHREALQKRHCAQRANGSWYRTIDRITPSLSAKPKLLVPDIKGEANIVLEDGKLYPHHNLYFITSEHWPLKALQRVLQSGIARLFVRAYSTKMRGGCLRFQAQYLRRIRLPLWSSIQPALQKKLSDESLPVEPLLAKIYRLEAEDLPHLQS
ncbi:MAG: Eco57I restriction-modification methylase domain-containing protein [Verrucomicrobiaceae bacterium]|nr:Eco57I restriction-modification methylase domain-containing protein [Verrucomicrobiaceae bacterium]